MLQHVTNHDLGSLRGKTLLKHSYNLFINLTMYWSIVNYCHFCCESIKFSLPLKTPLILIDLWQHLNNKLFRRLDPTQTATVGRLESGFLKLYVINCIQTRHHDKLKVQNASRFHETNIRCLY